MPKVWHIKNNTWIIIYALENILFLIPQDSTCDFFQNTFFSLYNCLIVSSSLIITLFICENMSYSMIYSFSKIFLECAVVKDKVCVFYSISLKIYRRAWQWSPIPSLECGRRCEITKSGSLGSCGILLSSANINMSTNKWIKFDRQANNNNAGSCF